MNYNSELMSILNEHFKWNKARMACFAQMLIALLQIQTVNLSKIARHMTGEAQQESRYRRVIRFFAYYLIDFDIIASFIFRLFFIRGEKWYLTVDRTNWKWGESHINILTLAIAFKGIAIPIYWELLEQCGNSDTNERIKIIQKFIDNFGKECIAGILADREFVGNAWFKWLIEHNISFNIRIKKNFLTTDSRGRVVRIASLFRNLKPTEERILYGKRVLMGQEVYLSALWLHGNDLLVIATDKEPASSIKIYALRWEIETLFSCLKSRGFHFEDTHVTEPERIKKLLVLLAVAFCWAHKTGEWRHAEVRPIKIKKHGRPAVSVFQYGLDYLVEALINLSAKLELFINCLDVLKPDKPDLISNSGYA